MEKILKYHKKRRGKKQGKPRKKNEVEIDEETLKNLKEIYKN
jgi:hypothetical protein